MCVCVCVCVCVYTVKNPKQNNSCGSQLSLPQMTARSNIYIYIYIYMFVCVCVCVRACVCVCARVCSFYFILKMIRALLSNLHYKVIISRCLN